MAKTKLNPILKSISGKIDKKSSTTFRHTPSGEISVYEQKQHSYASLHSPAQCRQRQNLAQASSFAKSILSDPTSPEYAHFNNLYIAHCAKPNIKHYTSLRQFIIHVKYTELQKGCVKGRFSFG